MGRWDSASLEHVACDLCGSHNGMIEFMRPDGLTVQRCADCALLFLNPRPSETFLPRLYDSDYFTGEQDQNGSRHPRDGIGYSDYCGSSSLPELERDASVRLAVARSLVGHRWKLGRVLEIGCATGEFCGLIRDECCEVVGIDISSDILAEARRRFPKIKFLQSDIEGICSSEDLFDTIFAFETVEHVSSVMSFFSYARRLLRDGGVLVVSTPNSSCAAKVGNENWIGYKSAFEHLYYLNLLSLRSYAEKAGFDVVGSMTGGGTGRVPDPPSGNAPDPSQRKYRRLARNTLERLRLLRLAQKPLTVLRREEHKAHDYGPGDDAHNLIAVFVARQGTSAGR